MHSEDDPDYVDHDAGPFPSWFWYGRYETAVMGGYAPPTGVIASFLYWCGSLAGRWIGPPAARS